MGKHLLEVTVYGSSSTYKSLEYTQLVRSPEDGIDRLHSELRVLFDFSFYVCSVRDTKCPC